jgi:hypothetical protein
MTLSRKLGIDMSRSAIDQTLTLAGVAAAVVPVSLITESWLPFIFVMIGLLMVGAGAWRLGTRLLPTRRVYVGLRSEVKQFIGLVRRLNSHALGGDTDAIENLRYDMKESVDRMVLLAGEQGETS